jgi:hypothetical protein
MSGTAVSATVGGGGSGLAVGGRYGFALSVEGSGFLARVGLEDTTPYVVPESFVRGLGLL